MPKTIKDALAEVKDHENVFLVVWDRQTGEFCVTYEGREIQTESVSSLFSNLSVEIRKQSDSQGNWTPSKQRKEAPIDVWIAPWFKSETIN